MVMASGMFRGRVRRRRPDYVSQARTTKSRNIRDFNFFFKPKGGFVFLRASRGYRADVTSATVNTFVLFNGENDLQNRFSCIFSRFATQDSFIDISQTVVKTAFVAA